MKSPIGKTLFMLILAGVSSLVAANFYPWPEAVTSGERINTLLFEEFDKDFNMDEVRGIKIVRYDNDRNELENIQLRRLGDKWILPAKSNFVVNNIKQITDVASALTEKKIREEMSDKQEDHLKYSVVDPSSHASAVRSSLGTKVVLVGRQKKELGSLIIGAAVKSQSQVPQRFVRIPSQPHVYVIDFDDRVLSTSIEDWIDPNLMQISSAAGQQPNTIEIDSYRIPEEDIATDKRNSVYRTRFAMQGQQLAFDWFEAPDENDEMKRVSLNQQQKQQVQSWVRVVNRLTVADVRRKSKDLSKALSKPGEDFAGALNKELNQFGFHKTNSEGNSEFSAAGGNFTCTTSGGVRIDIHIGSFVESAKNSSRYVMINASVDETQFPKPEKDADAGDEDRAYLRAVEERKKKLKAAMQLVRGLKNTHSNWFYVIEQEILDQLIPKVDLSAASSDGEPGSMLMMPADEGG